MKQEVLACQVCLMSTKSLEEVWNKFTGNVIQDYINCFPVLLLRTSNFS